MTYKIIQTENYLLIVDEDVTKAKEGYWIIRNGIEPTFCGENFFFDFKEPYKKIIAHLPFNNSPILDGVDLLPNIKNKIQSLQQPKMPIEFDAITIDNLEETITNSQGLTQWVGKYVY
jgi:hypothetical protein